MTFSSPWLLGAGLLAALVMVVGTLRRSARRRRLADFLGGRRAARRIARADLYASSLPSMLLLVLAALALGASAADPSWRFPAAGPSSDSVPRPGDLMLAIDVSASMQADDVVPTRLALAADVARDVVAEMRRPGDENIRTGLLVYAGTPYVLVPPTTDLAVVEHLLSGISDDLVNIYDPGSLPSRALRTSVDLLVAGRDTSDVRNRSVVLIGDGEAGEPLDSIRIAARAATREGVRIHTVGVGTLEGGRMTLPAGYAPKGAPTGPEGPMFSRLREEPLREAANIGRGTYLRATRAGGTRPVSRAVRDRLGISELATEPEPIPTWMRLDPGTWLAALALVLMVTESCLGIRLRGRRHPTARAGAPPDPGNRRVRGERS